MGRAGAHRRPALGSVADPCAALSDIERARLRQAAALLAGQRGVVPQLGNWLGSRAERLAGRFGSGWQDRVRQAAEGALWRGMDVAVIGLDPRSTRAARNLLGRAAITASGAMTGLAGLPGVLVDIPFTTLSILRSVAEIAREEGEDIGSEEGRRACLEVLALADPAAGARPPADDDAAAEAEIGYWTARLGLAALNMTSLVPQAARLLGTALSEKLVAQAFPVFGALAGAGLNLAFMRYYQHAARVHFIIRALERAHPGETSVRDCLDALVVEARGFAGRSWPNRTQNS